MISNEPRKRRCTSKSFMEVEKFQLWLKGKSFRRVSPISDPIEAVHGECKMVLMRARYRFLKNIVL